MEDGCIEWYGIGLGLYSYFVRSEPKSVLVACHGERSCYPLLIIGECNFSLSSAIAHVVELLDFDVVSGSLGDHHVILMGVRKGRAIEERRITGEALKEPLSSLMGPEKKFVQLWLKKKKNGGEKKEWVEDEL